MRAREDKWERQKKRRKGIRDYEREREIDGQIERMRESKKEKVRQERTFQGDFRIQIL